MHNLDHRKATARLKILNPDGSPAANQAVRDFNDGCWLKAPSGVVREDNSEKPVYHTLNRLIHGEWETHAELVTDSEGCLSLTGFKGSYLLETAGGKASLRLDGDSARTVRFIRKD